MMPAVEGGEMKRLTTVALWIVSALLAVVMAGSGVEKFTNPGWERMFRVWGYPEGFYLVIGAIEVVGGIGLLIPRVAAYSAPTLSVVMIAAAITQITQGGRSGVGEIVFATLLAIIAFARRPAFVRSRNARPTAAVAG
jgi:putative oxidoreductase